MHVSDQGNRESEGAEINPKQINHGQALTFLVVGPRHPPNKFSER